MIMPIDGKPNTPNYPDWNPKSKLESLKTFGKFVHQMAKDAFLEDKRHPGLVFTFGDEQFGKAMYTIEPDQPLEETIEFIKGAIREDNLYAIIHISVAANFDVMKCEALVVNIQSRGGFIFTYADEIVRKGDQVSLGRNLEGYSMADSILGNLFDEVL